MVVDIMHKQYTAEFSNKSESVNIIGNMPKPIFISLVEQTRKYYSNIIRLEHAVGDFPITMLRSYSSGVIECIEDLMQMHFSKDIINLIMTGYKAGYKDTELKKSSLDVWMLLAELKKKGNSYNAKL